MDTGIKLIAALAALLGAVAWPVAFVIVVFLFRTSLREVLGRLKKGKVAGVEVELEQVAISATDKTLNASGAVTVEQVHSAARIESRSVDIGMTELLRHLDELSIEYDTLRRTMPAGEERTRAMTRILVQMRALGPSVADHIEAYKSSGSSGSRLAAIAIMQMQPRRADYPWLLARFREDAPFIFYHAALALQNAANGANRRTREAIRRVAIEALGIIRSFPGQADRNTLSVLEPLARDLGADPPGRPSRGPSC